MGESNSDDHYIYYCGQESLGRNRVALIVNKSPEYSTCVQSQKRQNDLGLFPRQTIQHHSNPSLYPNHWCWRSWSWLVLWRFMTPSRNNTLPKYVLFIIRDWNANLGSQATPRITGKIGLEVQNEAGQRFTEFCQESTLVTAKPFPNNTILKSDWPCSLQPKMEKHYTISKNKTWNWLWLRSWAPYCKIQA